MCQLPLLECYGKYPGHLVVPPETKFGFIGGDCWRRLCATPVYSSMRDMSRMHEAANAVASATNGVPLSILTVGTGDAQQEERFIRSLATRSPIERILPHGIDMAEKMRGLERLRTIPAQFTPLAVGGNFDDNIVQRSPYETPWHPRIEEASNNLTLSFGNTFGNLRPANLAHVLEKIRLAQQVYAWDEPNKPGHLLIEWTAPYTGDRRPGMTQLDRTTEIGAIEYEWYERSARHFFGLNSHHTVKISFETFGPYPDGGYEIIGLASPMEHPQPHEKVIVAHFLRYSPEAMVTMARLAGFVPVNNALFQNGPSTIMIFQTVNAATAGDSSDIKSSLGPRAPISRLTKRKESSGAA